MILTLAININSHADSLTDRLRKAETTFYDLKLETDLLYKMLSQIYLRSFSQKEYYKIVFDEDDKCLLCGAKNENNE